jgi:hypothetical protein
VTFIQHNHLLSQKTKNSLPYNERYIDFLKFALHRIIELAHIYETEAKSCSDSTTKLFLYYLAGKKRVQYVILEMIAASNSIRPLSNPNYSTPKPINCDEPQSLANATAETILDYAHRRAEKDLSLYTSLAALEEDIKTKKLLHTLSKLSTDFLDDISAGYSRIALKHTTQSISYSDLDPMP